MKSILAIVRASSATASVTLIRALNSKGADRVVSLESLHALSAEKTSANDGLSESTLLAMGVAAAG